MVEDRFVWFILIKKISHVQTRNSNSFNDVLDLNLVVFTEEI